MRIAFLGLGLIGGSIARALRETAPVETRPRVAAWSPGGEGPRAAATAGVIDLAAGSPEQALEAADLVVLAAPPLGCARLLGRLGGDLRSHLGPGATVTDVASTKVQLLAVAEAAGVPYVGGHPMAGLEASGFGSADGALFRDRPWVVTEAVGGGDPDAVRRLARSCGARVVELDAATHDRLVAAISHLPLLLSVALVEAIGGVGEPASDWPRAASLAAGGWRDMTRLARGDATMGAEIVVSNAGEITQRLRAARDRIDAWITLLETPGGPDAESVLDRLTAAKQRLADSGG